MIDYEAEFRKFIAVWMKKEGLSSNMYAVVDDHIDDIYEEWLKTPLEAFGGKTPEHFFDEIENAKSGLHLIEKYIEQGLNVPGPLLSRMVRLKTEAYPVLLELIEEKKEKASDALLTLAVELISEMEMPHPTGRYIARIQESRQTSESLEAMADAVKMRAQENKDAVIAAYLKAPHEFAKDTFLDILSELPGDTDAYRYIFENFVYEPSKCGMYAHMLSTVGLSDCIDAMQQRLTDPEINYLNFCRVQEALEELGAETSVERDFSGDPDYEYMLNLDEEPERLSEETDEEEMGEDE